MGEELDIPRGYLLDLGNMTRLVLKGYQYTGRNEVALNWSRQYHVSVYSEYGEVRGEGWYDEGGEAEISISPVKVEDASKVYIFQGWERDGILVSTSSSYIFRVYAPMTLKAKWVVEEKPTTTTTMTEVSEKPVTASAAILMIIAAFMIIIAIAINLMLRKRVQKRKNIEFRENLLSPKNHTEQIHYIFTLNNLRGPDGGASHYL
ncbi:MAG: hypothetical protein QXX41_09365 [Nitrososphaerota archaeon]